MLTRFTDAYIWVTRGRWANSGNGLVAEQDQAITRADSRFAPSQWETSLQTNAVSHWLGANLELALHYLSQCWLIVTWTQRNKFQWKPNQENAFENVVSKQVAILFRPKCVKGNLRRHVKSFEVKQLVKSFWAMLQVTNFLSYVLGDKAPLDAYSSCIKLWFFCRLFITG